MVAKTLLLLFGPSSYLLFFYLVGCILLQGLSESDSVLSEKLSFAVFINPAFLLSNSTKLDIGPAL